MFEFIRTHQRLMQFLLLLLILPSFVLVGVSSYNERGSNDGVATVDGKKITQQEWEAAQRRQLDQARQMMGEQFDQKLFDTPEAKQAVLDRLVAERAINAEIIRNHLTVSDAALQKAILEIQAFRKEDGTFDMDRYKAALAAQGMTPEMFDQRMRHDLAVQQLVGALRLQIEDVDRRALARIEQVDREADGEHEHEREPHVRHRARDRQQVRQRHRREQRRHQLDHRRVVRRIRQRHPAQKAVRDDHGDRRQQPARIDAPAHPQRRDYQDPRGDEQHHRQRQPAVERQRAGHHDVRRQRPEQLQLHALGAGLRFARHRAPGLDVLRQGRDRG